MISPKVSVIIPCSRPDEVPQILELYHAQDYPNKEVIINTADLTIGAKRNALCYSATGDIIIHFDSDDYYTPDWISRSVKALIDSKADLTGLKDAYFYNTQTYIGKLYQYSMHPLYCVGATMCYWKKTWERNKFNEHVKTGEDAIFAANSGIIHNHDYIDGFTATIHGQNTCSHIAFQTMRIVPPNKIPYVKRQSQLQGNI